MAIKENSRVKTKMSFLVSLVKNSIILSALDKFTLYIYRLIKDGLFGYIFGSYNNSSESILFGKLGKTKLAHHFSELRYGICRNIESSFILNFIKSLSERFLCCRLKIYGVFLATFGIYTAIIKSIIHVAEGNLENILSDTDLIIALIIMISSVPLIFSKKNLTEALLNSGIGRLILSVTGYKPESLKGIKSEGGRMNTAFILGIVCGGLTFVISPIYIILGLAFVVWGYIVMAKPEFGVVTMFFVLPFLPTMAMAGIVIFVFISYSIKLFRRKRILKIEPIDVAVFAFMLLIFFGGTISFSGSSLKPALLMVCLMLAYFLTVGLLRTREWIVRSSVVLVVSAVIESIYAIVLSYFGAGYSSDAWLDSEMFDSIGARVVGSLDNPNMLGEYLILVIPIALSMFIGRFEGMKKLQALFSIGVMGVCLVMTWSRGAWIGLILAAILFIMVWHHRSIWILICGVASIPVLPYFLPDTIISRFTSIGNLADSSTSYRVYIWRASVDMIADNIFTGIGIGEGAWSRVYPMYTYMGIEAAPHSHNLYLQIWLELGVFGLISLLLILFLLYQSGFTLFSQLTGNSTLTNPDISADILKKNIEDGSSDVGRDSTRSKTQLRISTLGPMCGIFAVLVQGLTDYSWYNYRLFLAFWLVLGLASAYIRDGRRKIRAEIDYNFEEDKDESNVSFDVRNLKISKMD